MKIGSLRAVFLFLLMSCFVIQGNAQQDPTYSQYMYNRLSFNPAYAGTNGSFCATALYREQWMGLKLNNSEESTPRTFLFTFDMPVSFLHGGLGLTANRDQFGLNSSISVKLDYAYHIYWGPGNLSIGIEGDLYSKTTDFSNMQGGSGQTGDPDNPIDNSATDPLIGKDSKSDMLMDVGFGLYYQIPGVMYLGLSATKLLEAKSEDLNTHNARHLYLTGGYEYTLPANPSIRLIPSFLLSMKGFSLGTTSFDISCMAEYQRKFWAGASYRIQDAFILTGGVYWKDFRFGLAYDMTTSKLGMYKTGRSHGSLEVFVRYCFKISRPPKPPTIYQNTRYLN